jgi:dienelactone hydrolase
MPYLLRWTLGFVIISSASWAGQAPKSQPASAPAVDTSRGDAMIAAYFEEETALLGDRCLAKIKTLADWKAKRPEYRRQLFEMLGLDPLPARTDLKAAVTGRAEHDGVIVEKIHFQSMPGLYVTGNLYVPKDLDKPAPTILYVCGHGRVAKDGVSLGNKVYYQHHGGWFARHGYVCLTIDTLQLGEIEGIHHGTYREKMWWWNCRGYTPAGVEAWNAIRALDYLQTRREVDANRIGMTGRSGGGAYTWVAAALDERIKAAVPVAGITDLQNHVVDGCVEGHCDCMFQLNTYRWDFPLLAALIAPRPLLISNSDKDKIFPLEGVIRVHEKVRRVYRLYGAEASLGLLITEGPHKDTQELQVPAFRWLNRFLKDDQSLIEKAAVPLFEPEQLKVFAELPADAINKSIQESFVPPASEPTVPSSAEEWARLRDGWMNALREKCFAGWPSEPGPLDVKLVSEVHRDGLRIRTFEYTSQHAVRLPLVVVSRPGSDDGRKIVVDVLDESAWQALPPFLRARFGSGGDLRDVDDQARSEYQQAVVDSGVVHIYAPPRGIGPTAWLPAEPRRTHIYRRFMLLGQTADAMRVWDVRRAIQATRSDLGFGKSPLKLAAANDMAGIALYASLDEPDIAGLQLTALPDSHREGPNFLNVLKYLDLPEAVAMAAERTSITLLHTSRERWSFPMNTAARLGWPDGRLSIVQSE